MENALIILVRNLEKGKVKKRLAKDIGEDKSLEVYKYLLEYTKDITVSIKYNLFVFYSHYIHIADMFDDHIYSKHLQEGNDLGERMKNAFKKVFDLGHQHICIIGSDCIELQTETIEQAFQNLQEKQVVIGPSADGGYYLLGMNALYTDLFDNKNWGKSIVAEETLQTVSQLGLSFTQLEVLSDIDTIDDLLKTDILANIKKEI